MHLEKIDIQRIAAIDTARFICLDTETTGLESDDEVLSLAIVNQDGQILFNHLVKPRSKRRWPNAEKIHGIKWQDVKDERELVKYADDINRILASAPLIVGYNIGFDLAKLRASGLIIPNYHTFDLMREYAKAHGEWMESKNDYKWEKLTTCASHYGYVYNAHDALNDARATAFCLKMLVNECREIVATDEKKESSKQKAICVMLLVVAALFALMALSFLLDGDIEMIVFCAAIAAISGYFGIKRLRTS